MNTKDIIGLTVEKARNLYPEFKIRVVENDDCLYTIKLDAVKNRLNVIVKDGIITDIKNIG